MIRPMLEADEAAVRRIYHACHPRWPARPPRWYEAHPTLVLEQDGVVVGLTSYTVGPPPGDPNQAIEAEVMYGHGVYVDPGVRGKGLGLALCEARYDVCRAIGLRMFIGFTQPHNAAMRAIFDRQGLKECAQAPNMYPDGSAALVYVGRP